MAGFLTRAGGLNSGFMIAQVTAAALVSENKILSHPASVDSIPTSANKEDHVSMGMIAAVKAQEVMENAENVIGIEFLCAAQGIDLRKPLLPGKATGEAYQVIRREIPFWEEDRLLHTDLIKIKKMVNDRRILKEVEKVVQLK
jgi:histidine ammonia-lyase